MGIVLWAGYWAFDKDMDRICEHYSKMGIKSEKELDRNVFLRKYWFFDTISDIAERYSMRENTVKSMLFRTRNRLREFLRKEGIEV